MTDLHTKTILITGCNSGIGLALAKKISKSSKVLNLRAIFTTRERFIEDIFKNGITESENTLVRVLDVNDAQNCEKLISEIDRLYGGVDILVNNAGYATRSTIEDLDDESLREQLETNFFAPMRLIRLVLPKMRAKRCGQIINLSSVGGMMAMPTMGAYSASKFALEGASEALWYELKPWNIKVSLIAPGFINSESFRKTRLTTRSANLENNPYRKYYESMEPFIERCMKYSLSTPESIADLILSTINHPNPRLRILATLDAWLFFWIRRLLPRKFYHALLYRSLPGVKEWIGKV